MSKNQNQSKNASSKTIVNDAKKSELTKINLDQFTKQLESVNVKEKRIRETIYIYPEGKGKDWINSEDGKKWRNKMRGQLKRLSGNILLYAKMKRMEDLEKEINAFKEFYSKNFRINDYSLSSISQSRDEEKSGELSLCLDIVKSSL